MLTGEDRIHYINRRMALLADYIRNENAAERLDVNKAAEDFYCRLLNIVLNCNLVNMNYIKHNFPAVDLGDKEKKLSVQITSTNTQEKVQSTLDKFVKHNLHKDFDKVIVVMITGRRENYKKFRTSGKIKFTEDDIWDNTRLVKEIAGLSPEKQEEVAKLLAREINPGEEKPAQKQMRLLPSLPAKEVNRCIGREAELAQLQALLEQGHNPIYIWGLGGMGKTELAIRFGQEQQERQVHFVRFDESFRHTIITGLSKLVEGLARTQPGTDKPRPEQEIYDDVMEVMGQHSGDILIVDNVDGDLKKLLDEDYRALLDKGLRIVITTRSAKPGYVRVQRLADADLHQIFRKHEAVATQQEMDQLIAAVDGHTMTVDLMARTLAGGWDPVTAEDILEALRRQELPERIHREIDSDYRPDEEQERIYAHLRVLFNVAHIPPEGQEALRYAALLPEAGVGTGLFFRALPRHITEKMLKGLSDRGWLGVSGNIATIHPVVRLVCWEELKPTDENCGAFLEALWGQYREEKFNAAEYAQMAALFSAATEKLADAGGTWADHGRKLWHVVGQMGKALELCEKVQRIRENTLPPDLPALATVYNDLGHLHSDLGHRKLSLEFLEKALNIRREVLPEDDPDLAMSYNNVGVALGGLGDRGQALEYQEKALEIRKRILPADHPDLALSYDNVGGTYGDLGDHGRALQYGEKALEIRKKAVSADHPDLARSYNNVGVAYGALGDHVQALQYEEKALEIRKKVLPADHPDLAISYNSVGLTYGALGDHVQALEYEEKALEIREKVLPADHPDLARSYNNVGGTYGDLGDHGQALEYQEKALEIQIKVLPADHPDLAGSYNAVGGTYGALGDHGRALEYQQKALEIWKKVLPADHPDLAASYNNVGGTYGALGDHGQALQYQKKALEIAEKVFPADHPDLAASYDNVGLTYGDLGNHSQALQYQEKALEIRQKVLSAATRIWLPPTTMWALPTVTLVTMVRRWNTWKKHWRFGKRFCPLITRIWLSPTTTWGTPGFFWATGNGRWNI